MAGAGKWGAWAAGGSWSVQQSTGQSVSSAGVLWGALGCSALAGRLQGRDDSTCALLSPTRCRVALLYHTY